MAAEKRNEIVVAPEEATFWMDRRGNWCNRHGRFAHKKIIAHFHAAIGRDARGYFVSQINGGVREKVYFHHADTALFVFDVIAADGVVLILNTGRRLPLDPTALFIRGDALYMRNGDELIKFNETSMLKISRHFERADGLCHLCLEGRRYPIPTEEDTVLPDDAFDPSKAEDGATNPLPDGEGEAQ